MGVEPLVALPPWVLSWRVGSSAVPLVRVCAAGMASAWSWRTWRRALTTDFPLDMRMGSSSASVLETATKRSIVHPRNEGSRRRRALGV